MYVNPVRLKLYVKIPLLDPMWHHHIRCVGTFMLLTMKRYGVKKSWTQLFNIKLSHLYLAKSIYRFADGDLQ
ncbi:hypothetical protein H5410_028440 [Solanum commersonii]|uniref:Uncharacterized protein n=1 Tax=Solanum commersonii TaxID=4109 RepID=A0A9J5Z661_SOLCO|nr:hypothetical protein H5410_028440 [Solanum commersonii]